MTTISQANVNAINARLPAVGYPGSLISTGVYPNPVDTTHFLAKVDHQLSRAISSASATASTTLLSTNSRGAGALNAPTASSGLDNIDQSIAFSNTLTLSDRTVNETRAQFAYGDLKALPSDPVGPAVSIAGVASFGTLSGSPQGRLNRMYQVVNNLSHQAGAHALRAGVDFIYNDDTITFPAIGSRGVHVFVSREFSAGTYNTSGFTQTFGETVVEQTQSERRDVRAGRVEGASVADGQCRRAVRPAVPRDDRRRCGTTCHHGSVLRGRRRVAGARLFAAARGSSSIGFPACARERVAVGRQHDRSEPAAADQRSACRRRRRERPCFRTCCRPPCRR